MKPLGKLSALGRGVPIITPFPPIPEALMQEVALSTAGTLSR